MLRIQTDKIGDMAVVECEGRIEKEQAAKKMFDVATSQEGARIVVLDLSEVYDMAPVGIDALVDLQTWAFHRRHRAGIDHPTHQSAEIQNSCNGNRQTRGLARRPATTSSARAA